MEHIDQFSIEIMGACLALGNYFDVTSLRDLLECLVPSGGPTDVVSLVNDSDFIVTGILFDVGDRTSEPIDIDVDQLTRAVAIALKKLQKRRGGL